ncbi:MAG: hypothetical protein ACREIA_14410 [Opitutaceae bacterium]
MPLISSASLPPAYRRAHFHLRKDGCVFPRTTTPGPLPVRLLDLARRARIRIGPGKDLAPMQAGPPVRLRGAKANALLRALAAGSAPCMIARIGHTEMKAILPRLAQWRHAFLGNCWQYIMGDGQPFWWTQAVIAEMGFSSGFFGATPDTLARFADLMIEDLHDVDVLGSWLPGERNLARYMPRAKTVPLSELEPFYHEHPWTAGLSGQTVLVVHPFATSIRAQYKKRRLLFPEKEILPDFELKTLAAVQTLGGEAHGFRSWFDALEHMCREIEGIPFDTALIGAGTYGLPLAAFIKRTGRKAFHLGGATQLLFGIRGKRWDERPFYQRLFNEHWTRPLPEETPAGHAAVDQGRSYW